jgi:exodeoxyribonuclease VIII
MGRENWPPQRLHVSELAAMALSPAHFRAAYTDRREPTPAMRLGSLVHALLLGGARVAVYEGDTRRGKAWDAFAEAHADADIIATAPEAARAMCVVESVRADRVAAPFLVGRHEVAIEWSAWGVDCGGRVDVLGDGFVADLKTCPIAEPSMFARRAFWARMHAKMAWYRRGLRACDMPVSRAILIAVETTAPYAVTVLECTEKALEQGERTIQKWVERYKVCRASNAWPAYAQHVVPFDVPEDEGFGPDPDWAEGA